MSNKLKFQLSYIPNYLMMIVGLALLGLQSLILVNFDWNLFVQRIPSMIIRFLALVFMLIAWSNLVYENKKLKDVDYNELHVKNKASEQKLKPNLKIYVAENNLERKKTAWISMINTKIAKLERRASVKDTYIWHKGTEEEKLNNKHCMKLKQLQYQISDEYLNDALCYLKVDYPYVDMRDIYGQSSDILASKNDLKTRRTKKEFRLLLPKFILAAALAMLSGLVVLDVVQKTNILTVVALIMDLFYIVGIIMYGTAVGKELFLAVDMNYEIEKKNYLTDYFEWDLKNPDALEKKIEEEKKKVQEAERAKAQEQIEALKKQVNSLIA